MSTIPPDVRAIRLLAAGDRPRDVAMVTGLPLDDVQRLQRETPGCQPARRLRLPHTVMRCLTPRCGEPRQGRPPLGWVKVTVAGRGDALWHCGWTCARRYIDRREAGAR